MRIRHIKATALFQVWRKDDKNDSLALFLPEGVMEKTLEDFLAWLAEDMHTSVECLKKTYISLRNISDKVTRGSIESQTIGRLPVDELGLGELESTQEFQAESTLFCSSSDDDELPLPNAFEARDLSEGEDICHQDTSQNQKSQLANNAHTSVELGTSSQ